MIEKESVPFAPALIESMRSIGYSFETAIADLLDNSISANAKHIDINLYSELEPIIMILDDGTGMSSIELEEAMRYGSTNPIEKRDSNDLGRFGLGLKSASLSQCRKLTVFSKRNESISVFIWDLDHILNKGIWSLLELTKDEIIKHKFIDFLNDYNSGTMLLLEKFDRVEKTTQNLSKTLNEKLSLAIEHLSLVFHRYIEEGLIINVNKVSIIAKDPFLTKHKGTMPRREQIFYIDDEPISIKPYILPHINKLTHEDIAMLGGKDAFRNGQGFYIYRNRRLIIWGTWFNLERKHELNKLARVKVDIPNSLDYVWSIDIKKSTARLPDKIKKNLYNAVFESVEISEGVHKYRGRSLNTSNEIEYIWERIKTRNGYSYKINKEIPEFRILRESLGEDDFKLLENIVKLLEDSFPATTMYLDVAKGNYENNFTYETKAMFETIKSQIMKAQLLNMDSKSLLQAYICTEPYCNDEILKDMLRKEIAENE